MTIRAAVVLQARMGSARLPGKVLSVVGGRSIVAHCVTRLGARSGLPVILATTDRPEDDVLAGAAGELGVPLVRGSSADVLGRYVLASSTFGLTHVVRATADNPAVDLDAPRRTLDLLCRTGVGYVGEVGLPIGAAVEACTVEALRLADRAAIDPYDREHVTPFLRRDQRVASLEALAPAPLRRADIRLTVDRADDLATIRDIFDTIGTHAGRAPLSAFIEAADHVRARYLVQGALGR
jgi:spore coat polysaccharide biosynthesis protein SpsF